MRPRHLTRPRCVQGCWHHDPKNPELDPGKAVRGLQNMHVGRLTGSRESPFLSSTSKTPTQVRARNNAKLKQGLEVLQGMSRCSLSEDPEALKAAAEIRDTYYRALIRPM